jgi:diguanylate cyclase (GGDEF)-like protein/PAS domain S-box-containing protein
LVYVGYILAALGLTLSLASLQLALFLDLSVLRPSFYVVPCIAGLVFGVLLARITVLRSRADWLDDFARITARRPISEEAIRDLLAFAAREFDGDRVLVIQAASNAPSPRLGWPSCEPGESLPATVVQAARDATTSNAGCLDRRCGILAAPIASGGAGAAALVLLRRNGAPRVRNETLGYLERCADWLGMALAQLDQQRAIEQERERYVLAVRGADDGLWDWNVTTDETYSSERCREILGFRPEDGRAMASWLDRVHPDDRERARKALEDHLSGATPFFFDEHRIPGDDGETRWVRVRGAALRDANGRPYRMAGSYTDISERKRTEQALWAEKERAQITLAAIGDGVVTTDPRGLIEYVNPVAELLLASGREMLLGRAVKDVLRLHDPTDGTPLHDLVDIGRLGAWTHKERRSAVFASSGGVVRAVEVSHTPLLDVSGAVAGAVIVLHDVSQAVEMERRIERQVRHDVLTGLLNRTGFEQRMATLLAEARTTGGQHVVCYLDLDQFKLVNDACGHVAGDEMLRQVTVLLRKRLRESDVLARLGGDEFGVALLHCEIARGEQVANGMRQALAGEHFHWGQQAFRLSASIGLVPLSGRSESAGQILSHADAACFAAKDAGRNRVCVYHPQHEDLLSLQGEMRWVTLLPAAVEEDRFVLHAQPIVALQEGALGGFDGFAEVLVRMVDVKGRLVPPAAFIPAAERFNVMPALDRWVVRRTLRHIARTPQPRTAYFINLSGSSLNDDDFSAFITRELEQEDLDPARICFEITETAAVRQLGPARTFINELRSRGCRFALDDFGSGLSSFAYLKELPVDFLKVAGAFVRDARTDPVAHATLEAIHRLGRALGLRTIAESVEDEAILAHVRGIGLDFAQGYALGRPTALERPVA